MSSVRQRKRPLNTPIVYHDPFQDEAATKRENLRIYTHPILCLQLFLQTTIDWFKLTVLSIIKRRSFQFVFIPSVFIFILCLYIPGPQQRLCTYILDEFNWSGWWLGLGILSSIGLGTGMHSGLLFLFPWIAEVCITASACNNLDFAVKGPMRLVCLTETPNEVTFFALFFKIWWPCFVWGSGTAIGEIPPYLIAYTKAVAGEEAAEIEEVRQSTKEGAGYNVIKQLEIWTLNIIEKYGFWSVLLLSAWPNAAFDMCGICCGAFRMPFWKFFGGVWVGKACIKVTFQAMFFIVLFSDIFLNIFLNMLYNYGPASLHEGASTFLRKQRDKIVNGQDDAESVGLMKWLWQWVILLFVSYFVISTIEVLANQRHNRKTLNNHKVKV